MQLSHLLWTGAVLATLGALATFGRHPAAGRDPTEPPPAVGHDALVVEGDRDGLTITHAVHKPDPWAGTPQGFTSEWSLAIRAADGTDLQIVPLDLGPFDVSAAGKGQPRRVQGCVVTDSRVTMLVNAPSLPGAASYEFRRGKLAIGSVPAITVRQLAGGGR